MEKEYILALDEGTTSARAILFDKEGMVVGTAQKEFAQYYPCEGWVEQDATELYEAQLETMIQVIRQCGVDSTRIAAIGITNQRETVVVWDKRTGIPICPCIVWQCRRTADICTTWIREGKGEMVRAKTGLKIDAYFSGSKLKWILDNVAGAREMADAGNLLCGTVDTWLVWKLTGGKVHVTDYTNASRTMLFNIHTLDWDDELLALCSVPRKMLPKVQASGKVCGETVLYGASIPIAGIVGDQQAALFGQGCFEKGQGKNTYGTGCFLLMHTGTEAVDTKDSGLLTTMAASMDGEAVAYALEGSVFVGGAVVKWLRDELSLIDSAAQSEEVARSIPSSGGVYVVPAFTGLGAPHWNMYARGTIVGLTQGHGRAKIVRASLESIAYQSYDLMRSMAEQTGAKMTRLRADGGASRNAFLMQFQADIGGCVVEVGQSEATAQGAAFLAGLATGFYESREEIARLIRVRKQYFPDMEEEERERLLFGWERAVKAAIVFAEEE